MGHAQTDTLDWLEQYCPLQGGLDLTWESGNGLLRGTELLLRRGGEGKGDIELNLHVWSQVGFYGPSKKVCAMQKVWLCESIRLFHLSFVFFLRVLTFVHIFDLCFDVGSPESDDSSFHKPFYLLSTTLFSHFFFSYSALCFPTCCLHHLMSLPPTLFSSSKRSAELYSNRQKGWTMPQTPCVSYNLSFFCYLFSFCPFCPFSLRSFHAVI